MEETKKRTTCRIAKEWMNSEMTASGDGSNNDHTSSCKRLSCLQVPSNQGHIKPNEQNGVVLTFDYFKQNPNIKISETTVAEIMDRSKVLVKLIAILQTSCFIQYKKTKASYKKSNARL